MTIKEYLHSIHQENTTTKILNAIMYTNDELEKLIGRVNTLEEILENLTSKEEKEEENENI